MKKINKFISTFLVCIFASFSFAFVGCKSDNDNNKNNNNSPTESETTYILYDDVPLIEIEIENNLFPTNKEEYLNCSFNLSNTEDDKYNLSVDMGGAGIRLRGNSTMTFSKKPFRIKFDKKQSLFGLEKNKSWVLLADYLDQSCIRNYTAMQIANAVYNGFSPTGTHVVVVVNGQYQGLYLLCEQIDEKDGRTGVKTDINPETQTEFPFLVEMGLDSLNEGVTGIDNFALEGLWYPIEIKYPEFDERNLTTEEDVVFNYIKEYLWASLYTLKTGESVAVSFRDTQVTFEDLVDEDSYLEYILINEIMGNRDNVWKSIYMYKTIDGKLKFGPIWDFDWAASGLWTCQPCNEMTVEYARGFVLIFPSSIQGAYLINEERYNKMVTKFNSIKQDIVDVVMSLSEYYNKIKQSAIYNAKYWYGENGEYMFSSQFSSVRLFILDKLDFMTNEFSKTLTDFIS